MRRRPLSQPKNNTQNYTHYYGKEQQRHTISRKDESKPRETVRQSSAKASSIPTYLAIIVIITSLLYSSFISSTPIVLVPSQQGLRDKSFYQQQASEVISHSIFNKSKFTFDSRSFKEQLMTLSPEVDDVTVHIPLTGRKLVVGLVFERPAYVFTVSGKDYVVGANGVILAEAKDVTTTARENLRILEDKAPLTVSVGKPVLLTSDIAFIDTVYAELTAKGTVIDKMVLPQGAGELYVYVKDNNYFIKLSLSGDARQQAGAYSAVMKTLGDAKPNEYVDVRVGERVFVK